MSPTTAAEIKAANAAGGGGGDIFGNGPGATASGNLPSTRPQLRAGLRWEDLGEEEEPVGPAGEGGHGSRGDM